MCGPHILMVKLEGQMFQSGVHIPSLHQRDDVMVHDVLQMNKLIRHAFQISLNIQQNDLLLAYLMVVQKSQVKMSHNCANLNKGMIVENPKNGSMSNMRSSG